MIFHENRLLKYHTLLEDIAKFVVCCSCDWTFKGELTCMYPDQIAITFLNSIVDHKAVNLLFLMTGSRPQSFFFSPLKTEMF